MIAMPLLGYPPLWRAVQYRRQPVPRAPMSLSSPVHDKPCRSRTGMNMRLTPSARRAQGFEAQGNEFSYYMLIASAFVLNGMDAPRQWTVFPWAHASCNQPSDADQLRAVRHPTPHGLGVRERELSTYDGTADGAQPR